MDKSTQKGENKPTNIAIPILATLRFLYSCTIHNLWNLFSQQGQKQTLHHSCYSDSTVSKALLPNRLLAKTVERNEKVKILGRCGGSQGPAGQGVGTACWTYWGDTAATPTEGARPSQ